MAYPSTPPLLLTKRLSSFLHSSLASLQEQKDLQLAGATIQTALLVTLTGKLLAYDSPLPVRTLRTHCSVAASLWTIHASSSPSVAVALNQKAPINIASPASQTSPPIAPVPNGGYFSGPVKEVQEEEPYHDGSAPVSIAASFAGGAVFVVRRLRCGLLFACSTPSPNSDTTWSATATATASFLSVNDAAVASSPSVSPQSPPTPHPALPPQSTAASSHAAAAHQSLQKSPSALTSTSPYSITPPLKHTSGSAAPSDFDHKTATSKTPEVAGQHADGGAESEAEPHSEAGASTGRKSNADAIPTPTAETMKTVGAGDKSSLFAAAMAIARRQVDEVALLLDEKLGALSVPEENIGMNGFC
ncbi:MAG: hypothetical protein SEPTF4163_004066 [Sporothrix epigloea]